MAKHFAVMCKDWDKVASGKTLEMELKPVEIPAPDEHEGFFIG